jgi:hypothetical protein
MELPSLTVYTHIPILLIYETYYLCDGINLASFYPFLYLWLGFILFELP